MSTFLDLMSSTFSRVLGKIPVRGTLLTPSGGETYPIVLCNEVMGGMFIVNHIDELKTIPQERLLRGCKCIVNEFISDASVQIPTTTYQLLKLPQSTDYTELPVLIEGIPTGEVYYSLDSYNEFWALDAARQAEQGTVEYQYSDNYNNKQPPYAEPFITAANYQLGYADNSGDISKLIWTSDFNAGIHKWQRQKFGELGEWSLPISITTSYVANDFIDTLFIWTANVGGLPSIPSTPLTLINGISNSKPAGWTDVPVVPIDYITYRDYNSLWQISATKDGYYNLKSPWSKPIIVSTDPNLVRYGQNYDAPLPPLAALDPDPWHVFYEINDIFKASRAFAGDPWLIEKIKGESGEYTDSVYKEFAVNTSPDGDVSLCPTSLLGYGQNGWQDGPFVTSPGYILYKSECRKRANGTQVTPWRGPIKANGDSTIRAIIVPQGTGETMFKYSSVLGVKTVTPKTITLGVEVYDGVNQLFEGVAVSQFKEVTWYKNGVSLSTSSTIDVTPTDVVNSEVYSVTLRYGNTTYSDQRTISDATDGVGYIVRIYSATGFIYKDGVDKTFQAYIYENGSDITSYANLQFVWKIGDIVQDNIGDGRTIDIPATSVSGVTPLTLEITKDPSTLNVTYKVTETLTDIVDGASVVRYYSSSEITPIPLTPLDGAVPLSDNITWTTTPLNAVWVVERLSNTLEWNPAYRVKGEMGTPNGGFQKTVYKVSSTGAPSTPIAQTSGSVLLPEDWLETPPATMNVGEITYGSQAMFTKDPGNVNMEMTPANWNIVDGWSTPFQLTSSFIGGTGERGPQGYDGWAPQIRLEPFTGSLGQSFIAHYLYAWTGGTGTGTAPTTIGYLTPTGISATTTDACNIRGAQGPIGLSTESGYWEDSKVQVYDSTLSIRKSFSGVVHLDCLGSGTWILPSKYSSANNNLYAITGNPNNGPTYKYSTITKLSQILTIQTIAYGRLVEVPGTAPYTKYLWTYTYYTKIVSSNPDLTWSSATYRALLTSQEVGFVIEDKDTLTSIVTTIP